MPSVRAPTLPSADRLRWVLRIGVVGEFVGHGWVGVHRPAAWLPLFGVFGIGATLANTLMPLIGSWDITVGIAVLLRPARALVLWTVFWGLFTATLRPLAGLGAWELLERAGNYGVPFALFVLLSAHDAGEPVATWVRRVGGERGVIPARFLMWTLRLTVATLLIGHGGLGAFARRESWTVYFEQLGISAATVHASSLIEAVGLFEIALGTFVALRPSRGVLGFVLAWKVLTEVLRPLVGEGVGQFVERFGSYAAPLALALLLAHVATRKAEAA